MHLRTIKSIASFALLMPASGLFHAASAHVVLEYQVAPAASSYRATFKVGHGCGASATRQLVVEIPPGVRGARPMPKAGWTLEVQRAALAQPYATHGREVRDDVARVVWTAHTPADALASQHYDEFVVAVTTPETPGPVYWPVRQVCDEGKNDWTEIPAPGQKLSDLKSPAAALEILPASGGGAHHH